MMRDKAPEAKALRVLRCLDVESCGRLLTLDETERTEAYESLFGAARAVWPSEEPEPDHPISLVEAAVEGEGELAWAAALYALLHDRQTREGPLARYERAVLRFKLGHVLFLLDEYGKGNIRRCLGLAEETLRQAEALWRGEGISLDAFFSLIFELQSWMGHRYEGIGSYESAERAYSEASLVARNTTDRVAYTVRTALAMEQLGKKQNAYELLLLVRDQLKEVEDEDVRELWKVCHGSLQFELGGDLKRRPLDSGLLENLSHVSQTLLEGNLASHEQDEKFIQLVEELHRQLRELPPEDLALRHKKMTVVAFLLFSLGRDAEAEELLRQAEALEGSFEDELPKLKRKVMLARRRQHLLHDFAGAREMFLSLLPAAEGLLESTEKLALYGYVLEALWAAEGDPDCALILGLAERGCTLFESILDGQPGSPARRRVREVHQRFFEGAFLALLFAAQRVGEDTEAGQAMLARAWSVAMAARNPELRAAVLEPAADELQRLRKLEDVFHRDLQNGRDWTRSLDEVYEHELAVLRASRAPSKGVCLYSPPSEGVSLVFFLLRDLVKSRALAVLAWQKDGFTTHGIADADASIRDPLVAWSSRLSAQRAGLARDLHSARSAPKAPGEEGEPFEIGRLLPASLSNLLSLPVTSWFLFPDGALNAIPLEMLPDPGKTRFGQRRAVHLCLRPCVAASCGERVDFSRGWLGLGGVPGAKLPKSLEEVTGLAELLREQGYRAEVLKGPQATAAGLRAKLGSFHPSVLHFAVHGSANEEHPDACALILAADHGRPEFEWLPFRRIKKLDLSSVDLVVLAACKSLVGRSGREAGIEGLAWAFLQAGATQVIASRYQVDDTCAARFMLVLYKYLLRLPVAEALGHTRDECLKQKMPAGEVGAWSVWS